jgi:hypothetical protein
LPGDVSDDHVEVDAGRVARLVDEARAARSSSSARRGSAGSQRVPRGAVDEQLAGAEHHSAQAT